MNTFPRLAIVPSLRRGLGAAGAAVVVAFVGTAGLGAAQAHAAGISTGHVHQRDAGHLGQHRPPRPAAHPANLPPATTSAVRYLFTDGRLSRLTTPV
ncbi:hypothetical protein [Terracoccus luteus]|jgi:phage tail tape-measure protein|uniref:Phage tail tape-measure protein n=1 Tax=Terracoccus luteus TaxID=53356 RepID=A0A839Q155_9MICO|nr:hypothetical protein [Terracoccus luteus]MBB2987986.1 phage tail tape-measure protein [Terracoccus luteus]MCP2173637.1 phage tail tape-measure protein [Terracoccus luteus]